MSRDVLLKVRGGTTAEWAASTEGVNIKEFAFNTDTNELKIGRVSDAATFASLDPIGKPKSGSELPATGVINDLFYNTTDSMLYIWNGTTWKSTGIITQHLADIYTAASQTAQLSLTVKKGDFCTRSDTSKVYFNATGNNTAMSDWVMIADNANIINDLAGQGSTSVTWSADLLSTKFSDIGTSITGVLKESDLANGSLGTYKKIPALVRRTAEESDHGTTLGSTVFAAGVLIYDNGLKVADGTETLDNIHPFAVYPVQDTATHAIAKGCILHYTGEVWAALPPNTTQANYLKSAPDGSLSWDTPSGMPLPPEGTLDGTAYIYYEGEWKYISPPAVPTLSSNGTKVEEFILKITRTIVKSDSGTTVAVAPEWTNIIDGGDVSI